MMRFNPSRPDGPTFLWTGRTDRGRTVWRVADDLHVDLEIDLGGGVVELTDYLTIPAGFETDGASVPWWARPWLDPWSRLGLAAVLHDFMLSLPLVAKWDADLAFLHALRSQGVPAFLATILYFAVRLRRRPATPDPRAGTPAVDDQLNKGETQ